ncbi:hypothetical protein QCM77_45050 [Bradyrhizobium sp. SSUT18]|uniref:hypothetical protein n=1 Tax=Bradyrhizobium sp. SSUT18 TaxID=3040602 RepID=UPI00244710EA|nr:hypothetical protein [Bradyrhizobium sp. SSUT18]MDH2406941.1 hypothetical protein [Bradyrhizobium sp. SSUT18]
MAKPAVTRDAFRGLFAFYAAKAHHDGDPDGERSLLKLFGSSQDIPDNLLRLWSDRTEVLGPEIVGDIIGPRTKQVTNGRAQYDHASDFLHVLLRDIERQKH